MTVVIDLNDVALGLWQEGTATFSPGYAYFDKGRYQFGAQARATSRQNPRAVNTRYWSQLSTETLTPALGPARHSADLAHGHLQSLLQDAGLPDKAILLVPGHWSREQLSLLLGVTDALNLAVEALVHRSAAAGAASGYDEGTHVELQLHQTLVTPWQQERGMASALQAQQLPGMGLLALQDKLATAMARLFVQQSRFDPLRSAEAEQALYNVMGDALTELQSQTETQLNINGYQARVTRSDLQPIGREYRERLQSLQGSGALLTEYPLSLLPGFTDGEPAIALDRGAMAALLQSQLETLRQPREQLALTRTIAANSAPVAAGLASSSAPNTAANSQHEEHLQGSQAPTHLLVGSHARAIANLHTTGVSGWSFSQEEGQWWVESIAEGGTLNGSTLTGRQRLQNGDILVDANGDHGQLISVED